jgi:hypothetical protein
MSHDQAQSAGFMRGTDLSALEPGMTFPVTWTFKNTGGNTWDGRYQLVYTTTSHPDTEGYPRSPLNWQSAYAITDIGAPAQVFPGSFAQLTITIVAPQTEGTHAATWQLQAPDGTRFGPIRWVLVDVAAATPAATDVQAPSTDASTTPEKPSPDPNMPADPEEQAPSTDESVPPEQQPEEEPAVMFDLLDHVRGDGRQYEVRNAWGSQERLQTQKDAHHFYQVKNAQWEQFFHDDDFIYRDIDTSPGAGRFYRLKDDDLPRGSRWLPRRMAIGDTYTQKRRVQFYHKSSGAKSAKNSGEVTDTIQLVAHHAKYRFPTGIELHDVVELAWVNGKERYFYAKNFGLVGWKRKHDDPHTPPWSAIAEIHQPGTREPFVRERVPV